MNHQTMNHGEMMEEKIKDLTMEELEEIVLNAVQRAVREISEDLQALSEKNRNQSPEEPEKESKK